MGHSPAREVSGAGRRKQAASVRPGSQPQIQCPQQIFGNQALLRLQRFARRQRPISQPGAPFEAESTHRRETDRIADPLGPGRSLDPGVRHFFESRFGTGFGAVRVHVDPEAAASAQSIGARAYTIGQNIVFNREEYAPATQEGRRLLAHELTHVVQQRRDPAPVGLIQRQEAGSRGKVALGETGTTIPSEGPWFLRSHPTLGPVWYNQYTNRQYTHAPTPQRLTVLDWGEDWNLYNVAGGLVRVGEIEVSSVRDMVDRIKAQIDTFPEAECIGDLTIVGHGTPGTVAVGSGLSFIQGRYIGRMEIDPQSPTYSPQMRETLAELTPLFCNDATVTLRGCNIGQGAAGAEFVRLLAEIWRVPVRAPVGLTRAGGEWVEGSWQWGIPTGGATPAARVYAGQIRTIREEETLGDDEELIFELLEQARFEGHLSQVIAILVEEARWEALQDELREEDSARLDRLFEANRGATP